MNTPAKLARLLLVRHGQTVWHAENRYAGSSDVPLTEQGAHQAERLADWAVRRAPEAVACSPLTRARATAEPVARALGLAPVIVENLREMHFGWGEGRTLAELRAEDPVRVAAFEEDAERGAFPGAEPPAEAAARGCAALRALAAGAPGGTVLVVGHGTVLRLALCAMLGIPLGRYRRAFPRVLNAAVTEIEMDGDRTECGLWSFNAPTENAGEAESSR